jgi:hypothetical protein
MRRLGPILLGAVLLVVLFLGVRLEIISHSNGTLWMVNRFTADVYFCTAAGGCRIVGYRYDAR